LGQALSLIDAFAEPSRAFTPSPAKCCDAAIDHRRNVVGTRHVPDDCFTNAAFHFDDPLGPEPFPKERVLHALAHFLTNSHISVSY
jgi:hypothetical protein